MEETFCFSREATNFNETVHIVHESYFRHLNGMFAEIKLFGLYKENLVVRGRISGLNWPVIDISPYEFGKDGNEMKRYDCLIPFNLKSEILFYVSISVF